MSELFKVVRERPIGEKPSGEASCPFCSGKNVQCGDVRTTLVGGGDGTLDGDPNHRHEHWKCRDCGLSFVRETKSGNVWYADLNGLVLRGIPTCYEDYVYHCAQCGGRVTRRYTRMDGVTPVTSLMYTFDGQRHQRVFWDCESCHQTTETLADRFTPNAEASP